MESKIPNRNSSFTVFHGCRYTRVLSVNDRIKWALGFLSYFSVCHHHHHRHHRQFEAAQAAASLAGWPSRTSQLTRTCCWWSQQHLILALPLAHRKPWSPARLAFLSWSSTSRSSKPCRQTPWTPRSSWGNASMWSWPSWLSSWCVCPPSPSSSRPWWRAASTFSAPSSLWLSWQYSVKTGTIFCVP